MEPENQSHLDMNHFQAPPANAMINPQDQEEHNRKVFLEELTSWMQEIGKAISKMPVMGYKELDLYQFYKEVQNNGGFASVTEKVGTWSKIWKKLDNYDASITDASFRLKKNYERFLLDFEYKCYPERRQQQKQKPPKGKRSRSNSASKPDKLQQQNMARQNSQQIEAASEQLHPLLLQQQLEHQQLLEVQQQFGTMMHHPPQPLVQDMMPNSLDIHHLENELIFDEELFRAKLENEFKSLQTSPFGMEPYANPEFSPRIPPKRNKSEYAEPLLHEEPYFDPNTFHDGWNFNNNQRCNLGEERKFGNEEWVNYNFK